MAFILLFVVIGTIGFFLVRNSPEYALWTIAKDVQSEGIEGLKPHLTGDAKKIVDKLDGVQNNKVLDAISSVFDLDLITEKMKSELGQIEWILDDIEKSADAAEISVKFNYKNKLSGVATLKMIREEGEWKISGVDISDLDRP